MFQCNLRKNSWKIPGQKVKRKKKQKICKSVRFDFGAAQRSVNRVGLEKCCKLRIWMLKSALMQPRTSALKNANLVVGTCTYQGLSYRRGTALRSFRGVSLPGFSVRLQARLDRRRYKPESNKDRKEKRKEKRKQKTYNKIPKVMRPRTQHPTWAIFRRRSRLVSVLCLVRQRNTLRAAL